MRRALAQGGRLAVATWRSDEEIPFFRELRDVAERHLGPVADQRYRNGEAGSLEALPRDAGFSEVRSKKISRTIRFEESDPFLPLNTMALVGMSAVGKTMDDQERERVIEPIVNDNAPVARSYSEGPGLAFELSTKEEASVGIDEQPELQKLLEIVALCNDAERDKNALQEIGFAARKSSARQSKRIDEPPLPHRVRIPQALHMSGIISRRTTY